MTFQIPQGSDGVWQSLQNSFCTLHRKLWKFIFTVCHSQTYIVLGRGWCSPILSFQSTGMFTDGPVGLDSKGFPDVPGRRQWRLRSIGGSIPQNSSLVIIQGLLRFKRLKFHLVCMTSLFTLVPYYPPWDRSKKSVYQATLLWSHSSRSSNRVQDTQLTNVGWYPKISAPYVFA